MLTRAEYRLLAEIAARGVVRQSELSMFAGGDGSAAVTTLLGKGLIKVVNPVGERAFMLTVEGGQALREGGFK